MKTWAKATLGGVAIIAVVVAVLSGTAAYFVLGHLERKSIGGASSQQEIDALRARFGSRPPLVDIVDPSRGDIRISRLQGPASPLVTTLHIINWKAEPDELVRTQVPLWLLRFSSINLLSKMGLTPGRFSLTVDDIERYGSGIVVDYSAPGAFRVLMWVD